MARICLNAQTEFHNKAFSGQRTAEMRNRLHNKVEFGHAKEMKQSA